MVENVEGVAFRDEDWYGEALTGRYLTCTFRDVDLTETRGDPSFESCTFENCRFNAAELDAAAFVGCTLRRTSFFGAGLIGCKLDGSVFVDCTLRPLTVRGGRWRAVTMWGANLARLDLSGVSLQEADLADADLSGTVLSGCDLSRAVLRGASLQGTDLRRATLDAVDLRDTDLRGARIDLAGAVRLAEQYGAVVEP